MIYFVGAGSGAADLITVRGRALLEKADLVIYAGSLVNPALLRCTKPGARIYNSAGLHLDEIIALMQEAEQRGEMTVRLHTGDPSLYGAIREQIQRLQRLGLGFEVCPGVSSFAAAAAALGIEYTVPERTQTLIISRMAGRTPVPEKEALKELAAHGSSLVLFLSTGLLEELTAELLAGGRRADEPAAIVYKASWPDQRIIRCCLSELAARAAEEGIRNLALIIVGPCLEEDETLSRLYAPEFATAFREASEEAASLQELLISAEKARCDLRPTDKTTDIFMISFSARGEALARRLAELPGPRRRIRHERCPEGGLENLTRRAFAESKAIIFVGSCGIAVRASAPFLRHKKLDPAILAVDERAEHVVALLSGHLGGANELCLEMAERLGAEPVITTASDLGGHFAVDSWARSQGLAVRNCERIKAVTAALLEDRPVAFSSDYPVEGPRPAGLTAEGEASICISARRLEDPEVLQLVPKSLILGIGCKKGTSAEQIEARVLQVLRREGLLAEACAEVHSIDLKAEEEGLVSFCRQYHLPFICHSAEALMQVKGDFTPSAFVQQTTGADNVCERSALMGGERLLVAKDAGEGVTVAVAERTPNLRF